MASLTLSPHEARLARVEDELRALRNRRPPLPPSLATVSLATVNAAIAAIQAKDVTQDTAIAALQAQTPACRLRKSVNESFANATFTRISFDVEDMDTENIHDATNPHRMTCRTAGYYLVSGIVEWTTTAGGGQRQVYVWKNQTEIHGLATGGSIGGLGDDGIQTSVPIVLAVGDYVELRGYQNSGAALTVESGNRTVFGMVKLA